MALLGADPDAEVMYRTLYKVAIEWVNQMILILNLLICFLVHCRTPKAQAEKSGLKEIFTAIKRHNCGVFKCKRT
jgi:hypothetical protein